MSSDAPVFDKGPAGRRVSAERHDEPGKETKTYDEVEPEEEHRVEWGDRNPDTLWHPDRPFRPRGA